MRLYYYHDGQAEHGPFQFHELPKEKLTQTTPIWYEGLAQWTIVAQVEELSGFISTPPPYSPQSNTTEAIKVSGLKNGGFLAMPLIIIAGLLMIGAISWLIYSDRIQAGAIENLKKENIQAQFELAKQQEEQHVQLEGQQQKEVQAELRQDSIAQRNRAYRNAWSKYITAEHNKYRSGGLGGIKGLEVMVTNKTACRLEEVLVKIIYLKSNEKEWKTTEVLLTNVPPMNSKSLPVPDVERGTSVKIEIKSILSKEMQFNYVESIPGGKPDDPYFLN